MAVEAVPYAITADEYAAAVVAHSPQLRAGRRRCGALAVGIVLGGTFFAFTVPVLAAVYLTYGSLVLLAQVPWYQRRTYRKAAATSPAITESVSASADEHGVRYVTETADATYRWASYEAIVESSEGLALVHCGGLNIRWIAARAFTSAAHRAEWVALATAGIGRPAEQLA